MASRCALGGILGRKVTNVWGHPKCATAPNNKEAEMSHRIPPMFSGLGKANGNKTNAFNAPRRTPI